MVNTPLPSSLRSEAKKAAKILKEFSIPNAKAGPDKVIPAGLIVNAQGLAILTVVKVGFLVTARGGSGIVIAKLPDGRWSAPSAIGIAGLGGGFEIGAEVTDFVIILTKRTAVEAFSKGGNLTLGGNFTLAAGPLGRNIEGDVSLRSPAAIYTYSRTKGLFAGISVEGSALIERKDANRKFYKRDCIRAYDILGGDVEPPEECQDLYKVLKQHEEMAKKAALAYAKKEARKQAQHQWEKQGGAAGVVSKLTRSLSFRSSKKRRSSGQPDSRSSGSPSPTQPARSCSTDNLDGALYRSQSVRPKTSSKPTQKRNSIGAFSTALNRSHSARLARDAPPLRPKPPNLRPRAISASSSVHTSGSTSLAPAPDWGAPPTARALWDYSAQMPCDLSFRAGDEIQILTRTSKQDDWWEGKVHGKTGIFPANYVHVS